MNYSLALSECQCSNNYYWDDNTCIPCYFPNYFDFRTKLCS